MVREIICKVTTRYRKEFPKLKLETQGTEGEIEMLRIVHVSRTDRSRDPSRDPWTPPSRYFWFALLSQRVPDRDAVRRRRSKSARIRDWDNPWIKFTFERVASRKNWNWKENISNHFRFCRRAASSFAFRTHVKRVWFIFYDGLFHNQFLGQIRTSKNESKNWKSCLHYKKPMKRLEKATQLDLEEMQLLKFCKSSLEFCNKLILRKNVKNVVLFWKIPVLAGNSG